MFSSSPREQFHSSKFIGMSSICGNRHMKLEKTLYFFLVASLLMTLTIPAVFGHNYRKKIDTIQTRFVPLNSPRFEQEANEEAICTTPGCVRTAEEIIQILDEKVNPCDNFYKFACGGWINKHSIPDDKAMLSVFQQVEDVLNLQLKGLLQKPSDESEPKSIKMVKDMYNSCLDLDILEKSGSKPLQEVLQKLGGWPVVEGDKWDGSNFDWMDTLFAFRKHGYDFSILIELSVTIDLKNNAVHTIYVIILPHYFVLLMKLSTKTTNKLCYSLPREERRDYDTMYHKYTISQLRELVPQIDWLKYLNGLLNDPITDTETLIVMVPNFLKQFGELIAKTDKRIVANYMMWRVVADSAGMLSKDWKALVQEYVLAITGEREEKPRWEQCVNSLSENLEIALSSYYIKHYFKGDSKQKASEMVKYISNAFLEILKQIDWMDEETRRQAIEKANAIASYVGYPQELLDDSLVSQLYENLTITSENYFMNNLNIRKWTTNYYFSKLRKPNIKGDWKDHAGAAVVNAFYNPIENSIEFPAGILQNVFFSNDRPNYMNYGGIGFAIGHEITHGFDDMGKQFDKDGNNRNWWDQKTDDNFKEKAKCIIHQYGNYTTEIGLKVNGINTQGENIADNGGIKEAYRGYHSWVKDHGSEGRLPGLRYTPSQLFFISAANAWCSKYRPEQLKLMVLVDPHSPGEFRVIGPMSNLKEFSTAYNCPLGSNMNPEKKCEVW
nr:neprilysin-2-like [Parasteatoda tepidariorum]